MTLLLRRKIKYLRYMPTTMEIRYLAPLQRYPPVSASRYGISQMQFDIHIFDKILISHPKGWVAKLVARLLATADLCIRIQTSLKITK
jgi:hypothetical protein